MTDDREAAWWKPCASANYEPRPLPSMPRLDGPDPTPAQLAAQALKRRLDREKLAYDGRAVIAGHDFAQERADRDRGR